MQRSITKYFPILCGIFFSTASCNKFLDETADKSLTVPTTIKELQGLLDNERMFSSYISVTELSNDNMYFSYDAWTATGSIWKPNQDAYIWNPITDVTDSWVNAYAAIMNANVVLKMIDDFADEAAISRERNHVKGSALFYRAAYYHDLAQHFAPPYSNSSGQSRLGIPLKTSPNVEDPTVRSTVQQTYDAILQDLKASSLLLPPIQTEPRYRTRPSSAACYGLLSRVYMSMADYSNALLYSDSCLRLYNSLIDYNDASIVDTGSNTPFEQFNEEVIFQSISRYSNVAISLEEAKVDTTLYESYHEHDIRKSAFYRANFDGSFRFKGNYNGSSPSVPFAGIATDEIYLIRAECYARQNRVGEALEDLNTLLKNRWISGTFIPVSASSGSEALAIILAERRKELCFRPGIRWMDLRRLNLEGDLAVTLIRQLDGQVYTLSPNDLRYTYLIPPSVREISGIEQNPR